MSCSSRMASEPAGEHVRGHCRPGHASQSEHVEHRKRREAGREQRPGEGCLGQHGVRVRQRLLGRPKDLPVEERSSVAHVVDHSGQPPGREGRVEVGDHPRREIGRQRPCEAHCQRRVEQRNRRTTLDARGTWVSCSRADGVAILVARIGRMRLHRDADDALPATCEAASISFARSKLDGAAADCLTPDQSSRRRILFSRKRCARRRQDLRRDRHGT